MNNIGPGRTTRDEKIKILKQYKFVIAMENTLTSFEEGYSTEKIGDAIASGCIPIYRGDSGIGHDFNVDSFINWGQNDSLEYVIQRIIAIDTNDTAYHTMINEPWYNTPLPPYYMRTSTMISFFRNIFENL